MFLANKLNKGAGAPAAPADAQFNYVTMLLHGDGTNGAQNNTFLDSSTNNFTITRNGNTTQGSFSPYGSNWSNYFPAGSSYLDTPSSSELTFGTGDFTIEFWISTTLTAFNIMNPSSATGTGYWGLLFQGGNLRWNDAYNTTNLFFINASAILDGAWHHVAICRASGSIKVYYDGVSQTTQSDSTNYSGVAAWRIGLGNVTSFRGYLSSFRVNKGTAVYTSNFTPSTTLLTAISGTRLLTCQSNRFIDNSANGFTLTAGGTPSIERFNPFGASTAYSTSVIGGSAYFDGSGDYLGCGSQSVYAFGTSNFTMECWVYATSFISYNSLTGSRSNQSDGSNTNYSFGVDSGGSVYFYSAGFLVTSSAGAIKLNSWNHIALVRSGTSTNQSVLYINGVSAGTGTISNNLSGTSFAVGGLVNGDEPFNAYITNVRLNNTAVYTTGFTPPTAPLTAISGTTLLLSATNAAIFDNAMMNDLETVGNAQISTSVVKYGTGSVKCTGDGNTTTTNSGYLLPNSLNSNLSAFGNGDFTIEFFLYLNSISGLRILLDFRGSTETAFPVLYLNSGTLTYYVEADRITGSSLSTSTWYHIALSRSGTNTKLFVNGTQSGSTYTDSTNYANSSTRTPVIGANSYTFGGNTVGWYALDGNIDDLRITKGFARYTANFTAPTVALPDIGPN